MKNRKISIIVFVGLAIISLAFVPWRYHPTYFPKPKANIKDTRNSKLVELGRQIFYDPILSKDSSITCASCHSPYNAFAHTDHDLSHGIHDSIGTRNAPALFNLAWHDKFMWDGAINHLDMQALAPISHPGEMAEDIKNITIKLSRNAFYKKAFLEIYKSDKITGERILKSLSAFQLTLISANAKYDSVMRRESTFSKQEKKGYVLFRKNCNVCHQEPLFSTFEFANNGLSVDSTLNDYGRYKVTKQTQDSLVFKIPSLRNLKFSYPYMHDGRFDKLRQVLNHYDKEIVQSPTLDNQLKNGIRLSSNEKTDIIAFLNTLNDKEFVFSKKHGFPPRRTKD